MSNMLISRVSDQTDVKIIPVATYEASQSRRVGEVIFPMQS